MRNGWLAAHDELCGLTMFIVLAVGVVLFGLRRR